MTKRIAIIIGNDGKMKVATDGFTGEACIREAQGVLDHMNEIAGVVTDVEKLDLKEEYYAEGENRKAHYRH